MPTQHFDRDSAAREIAAKEAALAAYQHPAEIIEPNTSEQLITQLADALTPILVFIAKGRLGGTMQHRSWVWVYETRRDLIGGESIEQYAKRAGLDPARIFQFIKEFRAMIPAYRSPNHKPAATRKRMSEAARRRSSDESPPPPPRGKESFLQGVESGGSPQRSVSTREG